MNIMFPFANITPQVYAERVGALTAAIIASFDESPIGYGVEDVHESVRYVLNQISTESPFGNALIDDLVNDRIADLLARVDLSIELDDLYTGPDPQARREEALGY